MGVAVDRLRLVLEGDTAGFVKSFKSAKAGSTELAASLDDTRSAGKKMADALDAASAEIVREVQAAANASKALADALGPEMAASIGQSKIDNMVSDLHSAGLTFEEVEADAEAFAASLRKMDAAADSLGNVDAAADKASVSVKKMGAEADNSRSVMANMVGNTVSELPGISEALGPVNQALGQIGEYAAEGNISLAGMAATAGPMAAMAGALWLVQKYMKETAAVKAFNKAEVDAFTQSLRKGEDAAAAMRDRIIEAGKVDYHLNRMFGGDITDNMDRAGVTLGQFTDAVMGGKEGLSRLSDAMMAAGVDGADITQVMFAASEKQANYNQAVEAAERLQRVLGDSTQTTAEKTAEAAEAQDKAAEAADRHAKQLESVRQGIINYRTELENAAAGSFDLESAVLDLATSAADLAVTQQETADILADSTLTDDEKAAALRKLRQEQIGTAEDAQAVAKAYAESTGASEGTAESIQAQIGALSMLKGQYPAMAGDIQVMIDKLLEAPGAFDPTGFEDIGTNISTGIGRGIDGSSYVAEDAARRVVNKAMNAAVAAGKIKSPSRLFAERVGEPISAGIAQGIIDDSDKIDEALKRAIESAAKTALADTKTAVDVASTALSGFWNGIDDQRSEDALRKSASDAANALSEAMRTGDYEKATAARERLRDANYRLAKSTQDMILVDDASRDSWKATAAAGGLTTQEIDGIIAATMNLTQARADAAAQSDAINAEAAAANETRSKFSAVVANGLVSSGQIDSLKGMKDPAAQLASMGQIVDQLERFFANIPGHASGTKSAGAGLALLGEKGPELVDMGGGGQTVYTAGETASMLRGGGGNTYVFAPQITSPMDPSLVMAAFQQYVRRNGNGELRRMVGSI